METGFKNYIRKLDEHLFSKHLRDNRFMRPDDGTDIFGNSYDDETEATNDNKKLVSVKSQKSPINRVSERRFIQEWDAHFQANAKEYQAFKQANDESVFEELPIAACHGIDFNIIKMDDINQALSKFSLLPDTIKDDISEVIEKKTGIKLGTFGKLKFANVIWEDDGWAETEIENWIKFKDIVNGLETYKLISKLSNFSKASLKLVSKSDVEVTEIAQSIADFYIRVDDLEYIGYDLEPPENPLKRECEKYWKRRLRKEIAEIEGWVSNILGLAGNSRPFVSYHTLNRFRDMWKRNKKYLSETYIINEKGEHVCLADIAKNKTHSRLSMMYGIIDGMTKNAQDENLKPVFITLTLPSEFHPMKAKGYQKNEAFGGYSGIEQRQEMQNRWKHVRALFAKHNVNIYGMLVNESHIDGTPHRHILSFLPEEQIPILNHCVSTHFPESDSNKWRRPENGVSYNLKLLDSHSGATAYVSKYLRKTVNLEATEASTDTVLEDEDQLNNFDEFRAWASSNRIRRYGFFGLKSVITKWERIYKEKERPAGFFGEIWDDMKSHRFKEALRKLGAFGQYENYIITTLYTEEINMYEETYRKPQTLECQNIDTGEKWELSFESQWYVVSQDSIESFINMDSKEQKNYLVTLISNYPRQKGDIRNDILEAEKMAIRDTI